VPIIVVTPVMPPPAYVLVARLPVLLPELPEQLARPRWVVFAALTGRWGVPTKPSSRSRSCKDGLRKTDSRSVCNTRAADKEEKEK
jgi:hypothetical protein